MPRPLRWISNLLLGCVSIGLAFGLFEIVLRAAPALLPSGVYGSGVFSEGLGLGVHGGPMIYNKVRLVTREPNAEGFLDAPHAETPAPDVLRVGFFGDSYVEAAQVELSQTFFRQLPEAMGGEDVEALAFGVSGWGTLHAYLAERELGPRYGLDAVVYLFVENDPGDNLFSVKKDSGASTLKPYGVPSETPPGFELAWIQDPREMSPLRRVAKAVQQHSLVAQLVMSRITMLREHGVRTEADPRAAAMTEHAVGVPDSNAAPDTWPARYREEAALLGRRVLARWRDELQARGVPFLVFYVPRGTSQLRGEVPPEATWRPWLVRTTADLGIPLVDPTPELAAQDQDGVAVYDDHFSPEGHRVVAQVLGRALSGLERGRGDVAAEAVRPEGPSRP